MKLAIVYDRVTKWGGAERVLLALHRLWPRAPLYTAVYDRAGARWADVFEVHPSFLQKIPFAKNIHELLPWATPMAFESFSLDEYDVVLSVTSAEAKYVVTKPQTLHICYCLTPTRYLWSGYQEYQTNPGLGLVSPIARFAHRQLTPILQSWDLVAANRPDYYVAISDRVSERIQKYYAKNPVKVIYPPVDTRFFIKKAKAPSYRGEYFLTVSRLVGYKRVDIIIDAFNELGWPLVIIGDGRDGRRLRKMARSNIMFFHGISNEELASWYQYSQAFVYAADEDFGIAPAEALASGKPVVAYRGSGVAEVVSEGKTGELFDQQSTLSVIDALKRVKKRWYDSSLCRIQAQRFSEERFMREMKGIVTELSNTI